VRDTHALAIFGPFKCLLIIPLAETYLDLDLDLDAATDDNTTTVTQTDSSSDKDSDSECFNLGNTVGVKLSEKMAFEASFFSSC